MKTKEIMLFYTVAAIITSQLTAVYAQHTGNLEYGNEWDGYVKPTVQTFTDVPEGHWAKENIDRVVFKKWFSGYPDGTFHPNASITRAEAMTVFVNFLSLPLVVSDESSYYDVKTTDWYAPYIESGKELFPQITTYNGQQPFQPEMPITREDTVYALVTALKYTDDTVNADQSVLNMFKDKNSISESLKPYMTVAVNKKLVSGYDDGTIGAQDPLTRAEFATLLYRASFVGFGNSESKADNTATIQNITVTPAGVQQINVGDSFKITALAKMSDGTMTDYSSKLSPIASQNNITISGREVKAVSPGTATIRFLNDDKLSDTVITVVVSSPSGVPVFENVKFPRTTTAETAEISGTVSDPNNARLSLTINGGNVSVTNGKFSKTVSLENGENEFVLVLTNQYDASATKTITINKEQNVRITAYKWSVDEIEFRGLGRSSVKLYEVYSDGTTKDVTGKFTLATADTEVATIDQSGMIRAIAPGNTTAYFDTSDIDGTVSLPNSIKITVKEKATEVKNDAVITAYEWSVSSLEPEQGETSEIKLFEVYSDGNKKDCTSKFEFYSSDESVATVSGGKVKALSPGTAKITFGSGGVGGTVSMPRPLSVTVKAGTSGEVTLVGLEWSESSITVKVGSTAAIKLYGKYSDGSKKDITDECGVYADDEDIAVINGSTVRGLKKGTTEAWFSSLPKANVKMPGTITINVID